MHESGAHAEGCRLEVDCWLRVTSKFSTIMQIVYTCYPLSAGGCVTYITLLADDASPAIAHWSWHGAYDKYTAVYGIQSTVQVAGLFLHGVF
jgi:hypothetical protein